jgi:threonine aldolase
MAVLGSIQPQPLEHQPDGSIALADIEGAIKPDDPHFARTRLVVIENTTGGNALPAAYMQSVRALGQRHGLRAHIDGARLFNAAVALAEGGDPIAQARELARGYDSLSLCMSKGLGAPVGSVLLGSADFIKQARRARKMLGGAMRQAGVLAAAGIHALQHHVHRLAEDHAHARLLAEGLAAAVAKHPDLQGKALAHPAQTNIVFFDIDADIAEAFLQHLAANDIRVTSGALKGRKRIRWVTHLDVTGADVERALQVVSTFQSR